MLCVIMNIRYAGVGMLLQGGRLAEQGDLGQAELPRQIRQGST